MKNRSPSAERICTAAVAHFADNGYDASSLNEIAEQVGIRKASLYTHFASKDALFREVFADALDNETRFVEGCFTDEHEAGAPGARYCESMARRYRESAYLRFLLRTAYLPPAPLRALISAGYEDYLQTLRDLFCAGLTARFAVTRADVKVFADAYLGIVDSLHVELVYATEAAFERRRKALWRILSDSLACASAGPGNEALPAE